MKIVFVSNYLNHHQKPFCEELYRRLGDEFSFIATSEMREERKRLGYAQGDCPPYVFLAHGGEEQYRQGINLINEADVVIAGGVSNDMLKARIDRDKLLFRYSERPFKRKASFLRKAYHWWNFRKRDRFKKNVFMLCAGFFAAEDYAGLGLYRNRMYQWGYFPVTREYNTEELFLRKKKKTLLWCGRFLALKHLDDVIFVAQKLKESGYNFCLNVIGTGVMEEQLKQLVQEFDLADSVSFLGSMSPEQVRVHMEEAEIYLFTSDRQEGWGAVLNEAMNSGCAVVASHEIGSVSSLIQNNENGLIYESGNVADLYDKVKFLLENKDVCEKLGAVAYQTIRETWNAKVAAERFLVLAKEIKEHGSCDFYTDGPCSKAI